MKKKRKILKENSCPIRSLFAKKDKKFCACLLSMHQNETPTFVLRVFLCISRHIVLVWQGLKSCVSLYISSWQQIGYKKVLEISPRKLRLVNWNEQKTTTVSQSKQRARANGVYSNVAK